MKFTFLILAFFFAYKHPIMATYLSTTFFPSLMLVLTVKDREPSHLRSRRRVVEFLLGFWADLSRTVFHKGLWRWPFTFTVASTRSASVLHGVPLLADWIAIVSDVDSDVQGRPAGATQTAMARCRSVTLLGSTSAAHNTLGLAEGFSLQSGGEFSGVFVPPFPLVRVNRVSPMRSSRFR